MPKPKKNNRGQTVDLSSMACEAENLDRFKDENYPDAGPNAPANARSSGRFYGFKAGTMERNFREEAPVQLSTVVPADMPPPYLAYVGNLPHGIPTETVENEFLGVVSARVIKHDKSTFAYVEFDTRDALQNAVFLTGKIVGGRPIKVDIATANQRERLESERNRQSPSGAFGGRDSMGLAQPRAMGSRNASAVDLSAFSRENMGNAQPASERGSTPRSGDSPAPDLSREVFGSASQKSPVSFGGRSSFRDRGSKPSSPVGTGFPNFREGPKVAQPELGSWRNTDKPEFPSSPKSDDNKRFADFKPKNNDGAQSQNSWRRGGAPVSPDALAVLRS